MTFNAAQTSALAAPLDRARIAHRSQSGRSLSYLEGWDVMETANTIFGYDGWGYTISRLEFTGGVWLATVLTTVRAGDDAVTREDVGIGIAAIPTRKDRDGNVLPKEQQPTEATPEAQETAIKGAITDALKRALRGYGDQFGLSLYDKDGDDVKAPPAQQQTRPAQSVAVPTAAKPAGIGPERAGKLEGLVQTALTDQGASTAYALDWLDAALHRLGKRTADLTTAEGQAMLDRAKAADVTQPPDGPDGTWEAIGPDVPAREPDADNGETQPCPTCGAPMVLRSGEKNGRAWRGWFCSDRSCLQKPVFLSDGARR